MPQTQKRPPVKYEDLPRRAGQSLDDEIENIWGKFAQHVLVAGFLVTWLLLEWGRWYFEFKTHIPALIVLTVVGAFYLAYVVVKGREWIKRSKRYQQGRRGEIYVGGYLDEKLRAYGAQVFHDILCGGFNIDHVVVLNSGIYLIETKAASKPGVGGEIVFDGKMISMRGWKNERGWKTEKPIKQVKDTARWLHGLLKDVQLDKKFFITPVVIFPRWRVVTTAPAEKYPSVLVMNEKQFCDKIIAERRAPNFKPRYSQKEVNSLSACIADYQKE